MSGNLFYVQALSVHALTGCRPFIVGACGGESGLKLAYENINKRAATSVAALVVAGVGPEPTTSGL